jgi:hypothetical protein
MPRLLLALASAGLIFNALFHSMIELRMALLL